MASGLSNYWKEKLMRWIAGIDVADPRPASFYISLHAAVWNAAGMANEFAGGNYARIAIARNAGNFDVAAGTSVMTLLADQLGAELNAVMQAGNPALAWAAYDAANAGNLLFGGDLAANDQKNYGINDQLVVKAGTSVQLT